jgi:hypothetical protein
LAFSICRLASDRASLAHCHDIGAIAAFLVSDRHRPKRGVQAASTPRWLRQFWAMRRSTSATAWSLDGEAGLCVGGSVRERQIDGCHMIEVDAREKAKHPDCVQAHQHADHRDQDQTQKERRRVPALRQPRRGDKLPSFQGSAPRDHGPECTGKDSGEAVYGKSR